MFNEVSTASLYISQASNNAINLFCCLDPARAVANPNFTVLSVTVSHELPPLQLLPQDF